MTQDASKPHNIFEAASRVEKERRDKQVKKQAPQQTAEPAKGTALSAIFQRCQQLHREIADSLDLAFKKGGITSSQVRSYISRPQNFSERDWQRLEAQKKQNETMLADLRKKIGVVRGEEERGSPTSGEEPTHPQEPPLEPGEELGRRGPAVKREEAPPPSKPGALPPSEEPPPLQGPTKPPTPPPKKPKIVTRRHWIGM